MGATEDALEAEEIDAEQQDAYQEARPQEGGDMLDLFIGGASDQVAERNGEHLHCPWTRNLCSFLSPPGNHCGVGKVKALPSDLCHP